MAAHSGSRSSTGHCAISVSQDLYLLDILVLLNSGASEVFSKAIRVFFNLKPFSKLMEPIGPYDITRKVTPHTSNGHTTAKKNLDRPTTITLVQ